MNDLIFRTYRVKNKLFNIIYSTVDRDMRCFTLVLFGHGFQWEWMSKTVEHFNHRLFK